MEYVSGTMNIDDEVSETPATMSVSTDTSDEETSNLWNFFTKTGIDEDGTEKVLCKYCGHEFAIGKNAKTETPYGKTSQLRHHVSVCKSITNLNMDVDVDQNEPGMGEIDQEMVRSMAAHLIIENDLPFSFFEHEPVKNFFNCLNPDVKLPSIKTTISDFLKIYVNERDKLKQVISKIPNRVCLTSDVWTAATTESYFILTAHFVDENWKLTSKILDFCPNIPPNSGDEWEATILDCLKQWGIDKKVFSVTYDNASASDNMQDVLKNHLLLQNNLLCDGEFFDVQCSLHIFNLIVQEGMEVGRELLIKIRESIEYVRESDGQLMKFKDCVRDAGIDTTMGLRLDEPTRWTSTYMMLECAIKYKKAFDILQEVDKNYKYCPSHEEWRRGQKMVEFLTPFFEVTKLISVSSYATSNVYFMQVWMIECLLNESLLDEDEAIRDMALRVKGKFENYWKQYSIVLAFGAILDPRLKLDFLYFCFTKLDHSTSQEKVTYVKEKLTKLYGEYSSSLNLPSASQSLLSTEGSKPKKSRLSEEFKMFRNEIRSTISSKSELDFYLDEPQVHYDDTEDFDVLYYWKSNEKRFPTLSGLARDVLSIPIATVTSESSFSIGENLLAKYRDSNVPKMYQRLICTRNWLHGFVENVCDEDDSEIYRLAESIVRLDIED